MHTRPRFVVLAALVLAALATLACGGDDAGNEPSATATASTTATATPQPQPQPLDGSAWVLTELGDEQLVPGTTVTLEFTDGTRLGGNAGCNTYSGSYTTDGTRFSVPDGALALTKRACNEPQGLLRQETHYVKALLGAVEYRVTDKRLELLDDTGSATLVFGSRAAGDGQPLERTRWELARIDGDEPLGDTTIILRIADGQVGGSAGCNGYGGTLTATRDGAFAVVEVIQTAMACERTDIMEQEGRYIELLDAVTSYRVDSDILTLTTDDGRTLTFRQVAFQR